MRHALTRTRGRKVATITAALCLLVVTGAAAYYLIYANGAGEGSATLGKGTAEPIALSATFANGLVPGQEEAVTYKAINSTKSMGKVGVLHVTKSIDSVHAAAGCETAWFEIKGEGALGDEGGTFSTPIMVAAGETKTLGSPTLVFREESSKNQSACEGATLTIHLTSEP